MLSFELQKNIQMNQALYSDISLKYLTENHPEFLQTINFKEDQSFDCLLKVDLEIDFCG